MRRRSIPALVFAVVLLAAIPAHAVSTCGGLEDTCPCGGSNPYPCCENDGNCTWYAWHAACCNLGVALPPWGNANTWAGYAASHPDFEVTTSPTAGCVGNRVTPQYPGDEWGHVAWVEAVAESVKVTHQGCWSFSGVKTAWYDLDFFDKYICLPGSTEPPGPVCGDGTCNGDETCASCSGDCGPCCSNGACDFGETCLSCAVDCGPCCGNGACDFGETCLTCAADCGPCCGNGTCDGFSSEHCFSCPADCGPCCGNGSCDWGENCEDCPGDCGDCVALPEGVLEAADCAGIRGWAVAPGTPAPAAVEVLIDGAVAFALVADLPTADHGESGFSTEWPEDFKDGDAHLVEARASDGSDAPGVLSGSGRWVSCGSDTVRRGIWDITRIEAAGVEIDIAPTAELGSALALVHPADLPWPLFGSVEARTILGADPVDELRFHVDGTFDSQRYSVELLAGEHTEPLGAEGDRSWIPPEAGPIGLRLRALDAVADPTFQNLEISGLMARTGPWWNQYSWDAAGLTWGHGAVDQVHFERRPGAETTRGSVASWHRFDVPFDGLSFDVDQDLVAGLAGQLLVDGSVRAQVGPSFLQPDVDLEVSGQELRFRLLSDPDLPAPPGAGLRIETLRVYRNRTRGLFPWQLSWSRAWNLDAWLPAAGIPGLAVRLEASTTDGWYATGDLEARTQIAEGPGVESPAFDRVRGLLSWGLAPGFAAQLRVNGEVVEAHEAGKGAAPFDVETTGWFFSTVLAVDPAMPGVGEAWVEVAGLSFHRGGWWTTADNETRGLTDGRTGVCGIRVQSQPGWGEAGLPAAGQLRVHRAFVDPVTAVRFRRSGGAAGVALSLTVDGEDVETWMDPAGDAEGAWAGAAQAIGFRGGVPEPQIFDAHWTLDLTEIEVEVDGVWRSACEHPEALTWEPACDGAGCAPDDGHASASQDGGCTAGARTPVSNWAFLGLLVLAWGARRRRRA